MSTMTPSATTLVERTRTIVWRQRLAGVLLGTVAAIIAALAALLLADAAWDLPEGLRAATLPLACAAAFIAATVIACRHRRLRPDEDEAARITETALGCRDRELIAALQLARMPGELALAGHGRLMLGLRPTDATPPDVGNWPRRPWQVLAAVVGILLAIHLLIPALLPTVWPRFTDARGDHPPFSLTRVAWDELPERVREGDAARGVATVDGMATDVALCFVPADGPVTAGSHLRASHGRPGAMPGRVPLFALGAGRFAGEIAACRTPLVTWVEAGGTRTTYRLVGIDPLPVLTQMDLGLAAPAYAKLPAENRRVKPGAAAELAALPGSVLRLVPTANRALAAVWVVRDGLVRKRLPLSAGAATIEDPVPGAYAFIAEAVDGVKGEPVPLLKLSERGDEPPRLAITSPGRDAVATPGSRIPLIIAASDDLGLARIHRVQSWNGLPAPQLTTVCEDRTHRIEASLDLATLGVAPGEVITITAMARDTKPGGGQASSTAERTITIMAEDEYNALLLRRLKPEALLGKYRPQLAKLKELEDALRALREKAKSLPKDELDKALEAMARKAQALARETQAMRRAKPLWKLEPALQDAIRQAAEELERQATSGELAARMLQTAAMLHEDLAMLATMSRANGLLARLQQIIDAEQNTVERLEPLAEHRRLNDSDRVRLRELGNQEQELAAAIDEWLGLAPKMAERLRRDPRGNRPAAQLDGLAEALKATGAADLKRQAAQAARQGDGAEARRLAAEARDRLLKLLSRSMQGGGANDGMGLSLSWGDGRCFGMGMNNGWGMGGSGSAGMGLALGYGGDDMGGSMPSDAMDLFGPEALGDNGMAEQGDRDADGIAAMAAAGAGSPRQAAGYQRTVRAGAAAERSTLSPTERATVDEYRRRLEDQR